MAQTHRKRRSKHRGTAAGNIEARGRTGRKAAPDTSKTKARAVGGKSGRVPSWKSAYLRAFLAALFLFGLTRLGLGGDMPLEQSLLFATVALFIYVPLGFYMDTFIYNRKQKKLNAQQRSRKR